MDPMSLVMLGLIGLLIIFMVRNGRKRREQMAQMHAGIVPGAEVMLQSGIFGVVDHIDEDDDNRVTIVSGTSSMVVHRNAIGSIVQAVDAAEEPEEDQVAPDDDPEFGREHPNDDQAGGETPRP